MRKGQILFNPIAGRLPPEPLVIKAADILRAHGWEIDIIPTKSGQHITDLARSAGNQGLDGLFIAGGDGSINRAISGLIGTETALGVLPAGTANVFAKEIGIPGLHWYRPKALQTCAEKLANGTVRTVDIGSMNGTYFLLWAGFGIDGMVVNLLESRRSRLRKYFAHLEYALAILGFANSWKGMELSIQNSDIKITGNFILALVTNISLYAGGMVKISPNASLDDGKMDLWLLEGNNFQDIISHIWRVFRAKHIGAPKTKCIPITNIKLLSTAEEYLHVDGEPLGKQVQIECKVIPKAIKIIFPTR